MRAHRAICIPLPDLDVDVRRLMALANLAHRGYLICPPDLARSVFYELREWYRRRSLIFGTSQKKWLVNAWFPMRVQRVINGTKRGTNASPVVLDFDRGIIKLRRICHAKFPMPRWCYDRLKEGGDFKIALLGLKRGRPHLVLVAERDVQPYTPSDYVIVVDVNSWRHGIRWALIRGGKIVSTRVIRPDLHYIKRLYNEVTNLERKLGRLKRLGLHRTREAREIRKQIKAKRSKIYRYLKSFVNDKVHFLVEKALRYKAKVVIDNMYEESRRELIEEKLPNGLVKIYMMYLPRFVELLINQCRWYGIPYEFRRLPSTMCPRCGHELRQMEDRVMTCDRCGLMEDRDVIPMLNYLLRTSTCKHGRWV